MPKHNYILVKQHQRGKKIWRVFKPFSTVLFSWIAPEQLATGFSMTGKMLRVKCDICLWKQSDPQHGCCGEMSPRGSEEVDTSTRTAVQRKPPHRPLLSVWTCRRWAAAGYSSSGPAPCSASPHPELCSIAARNPAASPWTGQTPQPLPPSPGRPATARQWA